MISDQEPGCAKEGLLCDFCIHLRTLAYICRIPFRVFRHYDEVMILQVLSRGCRIGILSRTVLNWPQQGQTVQFPLTACADRLDQEQGRHS